MSIHYDYLVIGGGSGGYAAARTAREYSEHVAIVDGAATLGGLCILRGCMPSKTLIYSAEVLHLAQKAKLFGLDIPSAKIDMTALHQRKLRTIGDFADYRQKQLQSDRFTLYRNKAKFTDEREVTLDDGTVLTADKILVATGSAVNFPPITGLADVPVWTSDDVLDLDFLPKSVIVLGGGIVACELAQFLHRAGTKVTQIQRSPHILKEVSPEAAVVIETVFREEGIELITDTALKLIEKTESGVRVTFEHGDETLVREAKHLFNALGRKPNTAGLNIAAAGLETRKSGHLVTNEFQQTTNPHVYAAGDVAGPHEIVHIAIMQGEVAAKHAFGKPAEAVNYDTLLGVVFTDPQIGHVGLTEDEMTKRGIEFVSADYPFDDHGKSILMEAKHGYVKVWAEKSTGKVLAAEAVGKDASELIHSLAVGVSLGATLEQLLKVHWYHPTLSEIWSYPLEDCLDLLAK
ncbi:dihydrolipoyl dehydrogenase family protein [Cerasicoccus arenae]|uniref:Mercuric reductase n=1 Tax=Cerasicoccus arenae TaxID=424488 RepID=A0A8J3D8J0_9BACT|nr:NAD(P)/FAD-dependent oxidoreductase [Cerasicoccus arenae]MBK1856940.1 NAD(P)/FAD-dependent oxidoreductase [Cerasicoccus arenae]GHB89954.1 mercuric reductase [Cerasicoccus arenae]